MIWENGSFHNMKSSFQSLKYKIHDLNNVF